MLVCLYFDSNKKYNAVVKIQKEKNQTGPIPKISYCKLQKITNPQIIKIKLPQKESVKWYMYLTTLHLYLVCMLSFSVPVVAFVSAVLKDFQDSCDVKADGGKKNSLSVSYIVGQVKVDCSWYLTTNKV